MKSRTARLWLLFLVWLPMMATTAYGETMYAKKSNVKVTTEKSPLSKSVATLSMGDAVEIVEKSGRHYQVKLANGDKGWVFKFKLADNKPEVKKGGSSALAVLTGESSVMAREARSGGSIRGLKETTALYAKKKHIDPVHQRAVDQMDAQLVSDKELVEFQRVGVIGEFSGGAQ